MQHPDLTSEMARQRQARYRAAAGRSRLARPAASTDDRVARTAKTDGD